MQVQSFFLVIQVVLAISLISLILIQHGRGAQAGAAFGSGASATVFGARGSASFLTRITTFLAVVFFANSLGLAYISAMQPEQQSLVDQVLIETSEPVVAEPGMVPVDVPAIDEQVEKAELVETATAVEVEAQQPVDVPPVD